MLTVLGRPRRVCAGWTRRELLREGGAGLFGLNLSHVLAADRTPQAIASRAKSVLFVFLYGGPSQLETFDMKPDAAAQFADPFDRFNRARRACKFVSIFQALLLG